MNLDCFAFKLARVSGGRCNDAFGTGGREGAFAVADGLGSEGATSGCFAQEAADWYVRAPEAAVGELLSNGGGKHTLAERWMSQPATLGLYLDNPESCFKDAGCTFAGVTVSPESTTGKYRVETVIVGDCAVFHVGEGTWEGRDNSGPLRDRPVKTGADSVTASALRVDFERCVVRTTIPAGQHRFEAAPGSVVLLATDALAAWIHQRLATGDAPPEALRELLTLSSESQFVEWTRKLEHFHEIADDDVALVRIRLGDAVLDAKPDDAPAIAPSPAEAAGYQAEFQGFESWSRDAAEQLLNSCKDRTVETLELAPAAFKVSFSVPGNVLTASGRTAQEKALTPPIRQPWTGWNEGSVVRGWAHLLGSILVLLVVTVGILLAVFYFGILFVQYARDSLFH